MALWEKVSNGTRGATFNAFLEGIRSLPKGQIWRHNQAGDLPNHPHDQNRIDRAAVARLASAARHTKGYTYTHHRMYGRHWQNNRGAVRDAIARGFTVNLSANNLDHADKLAALKIAPVVVVLPKGAPDRLQTPSGRPVVKCPAQTREGVTCADCQACAVARRKTIIGFEAHGATRKVSKIAPECTLQRAADGVYELLDLGIEITENPESAIAPAL